MRIRVYNKTLCPDIWDENQTLRPEVYKTLLQIANDFYKSTDLLSEPEDILMLGSSVGYNWTPQSDIDLHILIDIEKEKIDPETFRKFLDVLSYKWNTEHEIEVKDHKVEVYLQDVNETNHSIGVYSIKDNRWVRKPCPQRVVLDREKIQKKYTLIKDKIDYFVKSKDVDSLKTLMKSISAYRQAGLDRSGEFSTENVVFKALRHTGELGKLKDAISSLYDKQVSITEGKTPHIWIGYTDDDTLDTNAIKTLGGANHKDVPGYSTGVGKKRWRWREDLSFVFWWGRPTPQEREACMNWLEDHAGAKIANHYSDVDMYNDTEDVSQVVHNPYEPLAGVTRQYKRKFEEVSKAPYLIVGYIDDNLGIAAIQDFKEKASHLQINTSNLYGEKVSWRYKSSTNQIFWWDNPTSEQEFQVKFWLADKYGVENPKNVKAMNKYSFDRAHSLRESKHDPFDTKEMWFVTYGGISPTKQKGYGKEKSASLHSPPTRHGFYAFVWPFVEKFLLGGSSFVDPKARGKGTRNRLTFVRDKEGNVISTGHPDYEKLSDKGKNWTLIRTKDNKPEPEEKPEDVAWDDYFKGMLYQPSYRKKFKYNGPLWHHLGEYVPQEEIWDKKGEWVKTSMESYKKAFHKELISLKKSAAPYHSGFRGTTWDHLEVFIDQKV